jgi:hypothetical protein
MTKITLPVAVAIGLGLVALIFVARSLHKPAAPETAKTPAVETERPGAKAEEAVPAPPAKKQDSAPSGVDPRLLEKIREMEDRVARLRARRDKLLSENEALEARLRKAEKDGYVEAFSEWRGNELGKLLDLPEWQRTNLTALWKEWSRQDLKGRANEETWLDRERQLRAQLTAEQIEKLHESVAEEAREDWSHMGLKIGSTAEVPREEQDGLQQMLGELTVPPEALIPEAHGLHWGGLYQQAMPLLGSALTEEQRNRVNAIVQEYLK